MGRGFRNLLTLVLLLQVPVAGFAALFSFYIPDGSPPGPQNYALLIISVGAMVCVLLGASLSFTGTRNGKGGNFGLLLCALPALILATAVAMKAGPKGVCQLLGGCRPQYRGKGLPCGLNGEAGRVNIPCAEKWLAFPEDTETCRHVFLAQPHHSDLVHLCFKNLSITVRDPWCQRPKTQEGEGAMALMVCPK